MYEGAAPVLFCAGVLGQACAFEALLRGAGVAEAKSEALLSVSVQPPDARTTACAASIEGAAAPSKKFALP